MPTLRVKKVNNSGLFECLLTVIWLCGAQFIGNSILIAGCLCFFLWVISKNTLRGDIVPVLLFFLPWSRVLKFSPGTISFFTLALFGVCILHLLKKVISISGKGILATMLLLMSTLLSKMIDASSIDNSYIMFFFLMFFFPVILRSQKGRMDFRSQVLYFSIGILSAAISAQLLGAYSNIARYMEFHQFNKVLRFSAYYGDPNFYSAHISAAISGLFILLTKERTKKTKLGLWMGILMLFYYGLISASKTFVLTIACVFVIWFFQSFTVKRISAKRATGVLFAVIVLFGVMRLPQFQDSLNFILSRFLQSSSDMSSLTTGRTDIWKDYIAVLLNDGKIFLLGKGFTKVQISSGYASHNTILQSFYQFGVLGVCFLIVWIGTYYRDSLIRMRRIRKALTFILIIGAFLPWMALDMLYFDEFFLIPLFVAAGVEYLSVEQASVMKTRTRKNIETIRLYGAGT